MESYDTETRILSKKTLSLILFFCPHQSVKCVLVVVKNKFFFSCKSFPRVRFFLWLEKEGGCLCHLFSFFLSLHLPAPRAQTSKKYIHNKRVTISQFCCSRDDFFFFFDFIDFFDFSLVLREKKDVFFVEKKRHRRPTM